MVDFSTINNKAEYETPIIVSQVNGEYEPRDETMMKYLRSVKAIKTHFEDCTIEHIPREKNIKA